MKVRIIIFSAFESLKFWIEIQKCQTTLFVPPLRMRTIIVSAIKIMANITKVSIKTHRELHLFKSARRGSWRIPPNSFDAEIGSDRRLMQLLRFRCCMLIQLNNRTHYLASFNRLVNTLGSGNSKSGLGYCYVNQKVDEMQKIELFNFSVTHCDLSTISLC